MVDEEEEEISVNIGILDIYIWKIRRMHNFELMKT